MDKKYYNPNAIINCTQHTASKEQLAQGVIDFPAELLEILKQMLTFKDLPTDAEICRRAESIANLANRTSCERALIGGVPFLMSALEPALFGKVIQPVYAFSLRESVEKTMPDGSVHKVGKFRHIDIIEVVDRRLA